MATLVATMDRATLLLSKPCPAPEKLSSMSPPFTPGPGETSLIIWLQSMLILILLIILKLSIDCLYRMLGMNYIILGGIRVALAMEILQQIVVF